MKKYNTIKYKKMGIYRLNKLLSYTFIIIIALIPHLYLMLKKDIYKCLNK